MATITINERTAKGKSLMDFLRKFEGEDFIHIDHVPNKETQRAIRDVKEGKVTRAENIADLMDKLNS